MKQQMCGLFGVGWNSFETLLLIFPDKEAAIKYIGDDFTFNEKNKTSDSDLEKFFEYANEDEEPEEKLNKYFRKGVFRSDDLCIFELRPVEFGVPLVMCDLD